MPDIMSFTDTERCAGMKVSAMRMERLPVPRMPAVNQSSTISMSSRGTTKKRGSGGWPSRCTALPTMTHWTWSMPEQKRPSPLTSR
ncbi:hypothetical protein D9M72_596250 [compost metagenome]